jgi:hypothetical protein
MIKLLFVTLSLLVGQACAQNNSPIATKDQLLGCWSLIDFSMEARKKINEVDPYPARYQWFCFEQDGTLRAIASTAPMEATMKTLREAFASLPSAINYKIVKPGLIETTQPSSGRTMAWTASLTLNPMSFDGKTIDKGTLTMGLIDVQKQKTVYWRYLVPMQAEK